MPLFRPALFRPLFMAPQNILGRPSASNASSDSSSSPRGDSNSIPWQQKYLWTIPHIQWLEVAAENRPRADFQEGSGEKVLLPKTSPSGLPFSSLLVAVAGWKGGVGKGTKLQTLLNR